MRYRTAKKTAMLFPEVAGPVSFYVLAIQLIVGIVAFLLVAFFAVCVFIFTTLFKIIQYFHMAHVEKKRVKLGLPDRASVARMDVELARLLSNHPGLERDSAINIVAQSENSGWLPVRDVTLPAGPNNLGERVAVELSVAVVGMDEWIENKTADLLRSSPSFSHEFAASCAAYEAKSRIDKVGHWADVPLPWTNGGERVAA
jgi:hypothetical protein